MQEVFQPLLAWLGTQMNLWVFIGLFGQSLFMMRFIIQWLHSERAQQSVVPEVFWYFSLFGGLIVLAYAIHRKDFVFILSQATGSFIYLRNIQLIWRNKLRAQL